MSHGQADRLPTDEVIEALVEYQRRTIGLYDEHADDPEACVRALVRLHLTWTEEDPDRAKLVARHRGAVMEGPGRERLSAANATYFEQTRKWMDRSSRGEAMPSLSFNVLHALVFAPTQEIAKHWLGGRLKKQPTEYADTMGAAAWAGIVAAAAEPKPTPSDSDTPRGGSS